MAVSKDFKKIHQTTKTIFIVKKLKLMKIMSLISMKKNLHLIKGIKVKNNGKINKKQNKTLIQIIKIY
jgi:hypothetical protein